MNELLKYKAVIIEDPSVSASRMISGALDELSEELVQKEISSVRVPSYREALPVIYNDMDVDAFLLSTDMMLDQNSENEAFDLLKTIHSRQPGVPVFLLADRAACSEALAVELLMDANEFVWIFDDSSCFIAGRVRSAIHRFRERLLPPLMKAIWAYNENYHEYSWAAPGHQGGIGFTKGSSGKKFYDFYGENLFRTDTGIERSSIGSLLDHTGAFGESEKFAAATFGADISFSGICGTSGSNRSIIQAVLAAGDVAVCDRNCHKSIEQGLINSGAVPVYMMPMRNRYGIIGPIPESEMSKENIKNKTDALKLSAGSDKRAYAVVTNCTYDGICYNAVRAAELLSGSVDRIHFDEAWYGYAKFNPLYKGHFAMNDETAGAAGGATLFATHSTHKLLTALSQASFIHMRKGRKAPTFDQLNQGYMLNATTSPLYAICASNDTAVKMMADNGTVLTEDIIGEAVDFRQALARTEREFNKQNSWFFKIWNAPAVTDPATGQMFEFADAPRKLLMTEQSCWELRPGDKWHGFEQLTDKHWAMLDPVKVSILCPGINESGTISGNAVPAALVSAYIYDRGIVPTRTTDFQLMFLFSPGITKGKWVTLLNTLLNFKEIYDNDLPLENIFPQLCCKYEERYGNLTVKQLAKEMTAHLQKHQPGEKLNKAFQNLPVQKMTPREAYMNIVRGNTELVPVSEVTGRIAANALLPYPPGIPLMISGEAFSTDSPQAEYLQTLEKWDQEFPGFEHVTEGCDVINGIYHVPCIKN